ncbi:hypothetical protein NDU88_001932 [Pleurodeles waltl]|uniref:Uncharacterized protein n=1 Tax=Pleurodeles waltl TaxID=8319 RepID=A0AAV7W1R4_PLEWA|nr:hypothetical protein NDU88_001932 [Pleurodeles waltl]
MPRLRACSVVEGGLLRDVGHQESSHTEVVFPKMMRSVLSELSLRQLSLIQVATTFIPEWKFLLAISASLGREMMSCVSSVYDTMFILWLLMMAASGVMYMLSWTDPLSPSRKEGVDPFQGCSAESFDMESGAQCAVDDHVEGRRQVEEYECCGVASV